MAPQETSDYPSHPSPVAVPLHVFPDHACSYLPGRVSTSRGFAIGEMPGEVYHALMNAGFRRSGALVYQPVCRGCRSCVALRVPVGTFQPSKSQRRCVRKNADVVLAWGAPAATDEKFDLYQRYSTLWHDKPVSETDDPRDARETFESFLYQSPVETIECTYRDAAGKLLGVGICDVCASSLSSVYFYHEPAEHRRGLGTFAALCEIETARKLEIPHYYLGFWIHGCATMQYKSKFTPCEILHGDGVWRPII